MHWLLIVLMLVLVIGPVLYVLPTAKDKRLARLRERARMAGLQVKLASLPKLNPTPDERVNAGGTKRDPQLSSVGYGLNHDLGDHISGSTRLQRIPDDVTVPVDERVPGWHVIESAAWHQGLFGHEALREVLNALPEWIVAVGIDRRVITCYWDEKELDDQDRVAQIAANLADFHQAYRRLVGVEGG